MKLLHAITKYFQINWKIERTKICGSVFLSKNKIITKMKLLVGNSAITEVNELKNIKFMFFRMQIFHIYNLKSKCHNYINFNLNVKTKAQERLV